MLNLYRHLLSYRRSTPALQHGDYQPVDPTPPEYFIYIRHLLGHRPILIALNFTSQEQRLRLSQYGTGKLAISTHLDRSGSIDFSDLQLRPNEGLIIELD